MTAPDNASKQADEMRDAVAKLYTPWKDRKHKPKRRHKNFVESIGQDAQRVFHVRPDDILFGRGRAYQNHPGNRRMRAIVFKHKAEYDKVHRSRKREVVEATYDEITQHGARFLYKSKDEQDQDSYAIVNMQTALQKVRNTLGAKLSAKEKREAAIKMLDVDRQQRAPPAAASSPVFAAKSIGSMGAGKPAAFSSTAGDPITSNLKLKEDLLSGSEELMRQQEPSSLLGLIPRPLSASMLPSSLLGRTGLEASLLASRAATGAGSLYPPRSSLAAEAALLDPTLTSPSLLLGRLAPPTLPMSLLGAGPLLGPSSLLPPSSLSDELRRQYVASQEQTPLGGGSGLRSPYL